MTYAAVARVAALDPVVVKGVFAVIIAVVAFIGTVWLLLGLILGVRLGYFVMGATLFGIMVILSGIWLGTRLGPKGPETSYHGIGIGPELQSVEGFGATYEVSDYPGGEWEKPKQGGQLADLEGGDDTAAQATTATPILETFVSTALSEIPGKRDSVKESVHGTIDLDAQKFDLTDIRMKEGTVNGKPSIIVMAKAVPSESLKVDTLGEGVEEGEVADFLVDPGDQVTAGQPVMQVKTQTGTVEVKASLTGKVLSLDLAKGDKIKPEVPFGEIDLTGQPEAPPPVEVAAVRVRGAVSVPALKYLVVSLVLFAVHMVGLSRTERAMKAEPQPA